MSLAVAGIRKFRTRSATIVSLVIAVALVALELVLVGVAYRSATTAQGGTDRATLAWFLVFPGAYDAILALVFEFVAIIGLIYVATASGSEWTWGTLKVAVARGHSRWGYALSTFASLAAILLVGLLITFAVGVVGAIVGASVAGVSPGNPADPGALVGVFLKLVRCWIALLGLTSVGYAVAMIARNQMAGIGAVIAYFVASIAGPALLPDIVQQIFRYLPFSAGADAIGLQGPPTTAASAPSTALDPNLALLVTVGWLAACLVAASISVERAEISG
jgi:ABC-type transport system involved in multi-copper enzyme maturation permease subunit